MEIESCAPVSRAGLNYRGQIIDQVALEGLDGITLQALKLRLKLEEAETEAANFIWAVIRSCKEIAIYQLTKDRGKLELYDRYLLLK